MLCAIVAVARKLAGTLHRMWIDGSDFNVGFGAKVSTHTTKTVWIDAYARAGRAL